MNYSIVFSGCFAFIAWIYLTLTENIITDTFMKIIRDQASSASQYNPLYGALINLIPSIVVFVGFFALCESISNALRVD